MGRFRLRNNYDAVDDHANGDNDISIVRKNNPYFYQSNYDDNGHHHTTDPTMRWNREDDCNGFINEGYQAIVPGISRDINFANTNNDSSATRRRRTRFSCEGEGDCNEPYNPEDRQDDEYNYHEHPSYSKINQRQLLQPHQENLNLRTTGIRPMGFRMFIRTSKSQKPTEMFAEFVYPDDEDRINPRAYDFHLKNNNYFDSDGSSDYNFEEDNNNKNNKQRRCRYLMLILLTFVGISLIVTRYYSYIPPAPPEPRPYSNSQSTFVNLQRVEKDEGIAIDTATSNSASTKGTSPTTWTTYISLHTTNLMESVTALTICAPYHVGKWVVVNAWHDVSRSFQSKHFPWQEGLAQLYNFDKAAAYDATLAAFSSWKESLWPGAIVAWLEKQLGQIDVLMKTKTPTFSSKTPAKEENCPLQVTSLNNFMNKQERLVRQSIVGQDRAIDLFLEAIMAWWWHPNTDLTSTTKTTSTNSVDSTFTTKRTRNHRGRNPLVVFAAGEPHTGKRSLVGSIAKYVLFHHCAEDRYAVLKIFGYEWRNVDLPTASSSTTTSCINTDSGNDCTTSSSAKQIAATSALEKLKQTLYQVIVNHVSSTSSSSQASSRSGSSGVVIVISNIEEMHPYLLQWLLLDLTPIESSVSSMTTVPHQQRSDVEQEKDSSPPLYEVCQNSVIVLTSSVIGIRSIMKSIERNSVSGDVDYNSRSRLTKSPKLLTDMEYELQSYLNKHIYNSFANFDENGGGSSGRVNGMGNHNSNIVMPNHDASKLKNKVLVSKSVHTYLPFAPITQWELKQILHMRISNIGRYYSNYNSDDADGALGSVGVCTFRGSDVGDDDDNNGGFQITENALNAFTHESRIDYLGLRKSTSPSTTTDSNDNSSTKRQKNHPKQQLSDNASKSPVSPPWIKFAIKGASVFDEKNSITLKKIHAQIHRCCYRFGNANTDTTFSTGEYEVNLIGDISRSTAYSKADESIDYIRYNSHRHQLQSQQRPASNPNSTVVLDYDQIHDKAILKLCQRREERTSNEIESNTNNPTQSSTTTTTTTKTPGTATSSSTLCSILCQFEI